MSSRSQSLRRSLGAGDFAPCELLDPSSPISIAGRARWETARHRRGRNVKENCKASMAGSSPMSRGSRARTRRLCEALGGNLWNRDTAPGAVTGMARYVRPKLTALAAGRGPTFSLEK